MEIEIKATLRDEVSVIAKIAALGCEFGAPVTQDDTVFVRVLGTLDDFLSNDVFLRIRIQGDGRVILTAKRPATKGAEVLVKAEHEVQVNSAAEAKQILGLMGYQPAVRVKKTRRKTHYGAYEICLDEIEGLGAFIELEVMGEESEAAALQSRMFSFLQELGVQADDQVKKGYDILMIEKQGLPTD